MLVALALLVTALLFFFEWLGSEQSQKWVESPVTAPVEKPASPTATKKE
jgi:hypothetical protein